MRSQPAEASTPGSILADAVRGWDRFWFTPADPTTLAFIRIAAGLIVLYVHICYSWDLFAFVGPDAWFNHELGGYAIREVPQWAVGMGWADQPYQYASGTYLWSIYFHVADPVWIVTLHIFFLLAMLAFTVGFWTPVAGVLTWLGAMSYVQRAGTTVFGLDTMMMIVLLYLAIGPCGAVLSVDRWLACLRARRRGEAEPEVEPSIMANLSIRLLQVHFCVVYLAAGTSKLLGPRWWTGTALNDVVLNASFAPMEYAPYYHAIKWLASHRLLWEIAMSGSILYTLLLEIGFPFLVWDPRWRWAMICGSVFLHTGIAVFMGLTTFSLMMIVMVASFIPPPVIAQLATRLEEAIARLFGGKREPRREAGALVLGR